MKANEQGTLLPLRVHPGSRREGLDGTHNGALRVRVHTAPEKGKANDAICKLLAKILDCRKSSLHIVSGQNSRNKTVLIEDLGPSIVLRTIHKHLPLSKEIVFDDPSV
ncbi:MAG: DUF167 domain-containing protein [Planctomycetota bacterium]|jgi:hypothetical protein|nr:DUF167 domain-containing protein [Planctomycetota bacterium]